MPLRSRRHRQVILDIGVHYACLFGPLPCLGRSLPVLGVAGKLGDFDQDLGLEGARDFLLVLFEKPRHLVRRLFLLQIGEEFPECLLLFGQLEKIEVNSQRLIGFIHYLIDDQEFFGDISRFSRFAYLLIEPRRIGIALGVEIESCKLSL